MQKEWAVRVGIIERIVRETATYTISQQRILASPV
jgi:hypothetical protein